MNDERCRGLKPKAEGGEEQGGRRKEIANDEWCGGRSGEREGGETVGGAKGQQCRQVVFGVSAVHEVSRHASGVIVGEMKIGFPFSRE
ncbi:MAG: hypothetical protein A3F74_05540 [Betaproteobacteria bacterium RIFCSPLOWO2_12_FULL_62_58]|nr:MAG: hypothetical protein A3F74_05540 [Betaproteobacteria bacterium RIFCSPLOWO2_12_FULL_62_58]